MKVNDIIAQFRTLVNASPVPKALCWMGLWTLTALLVVVVNFSSTVALPLVTLPIYFIGILFGLMSLYVYLDGKCFTGIADNFHLNGWKLLLVVAIVHLIVMLILGPNIIADFKFQWDELHTAEKFSDWHPVAYGAVLWLCIHLWDNYLTPAILQILVFASLVVWLGRIFERLCLRRRVSLVILGFLVFSPVALLVIGEPSKDVAFALAALGFVLSFYEVVISKGGWLRSWWHILVFCCFLFGASFFRHNGFFLTVPVLLFFPFALRGRCFLQGRVLVLYALSISILVGYPLARRVCFDRGIITNNENQRFAEAIGVPLAILGDALTAQYDRMVEKAPFAVEYCEDLAPLEDWRNHYKGYANSIKPYLRYERLAARPQSDFYRALLETIVACPASAFFSLRGITSIGWKPNNTTSYMACGFLPYSFVKRELHAVLDPFLCPPIGWLFATPGFVFVCMLLLSGYAFVRSGLRNLAVPAGIVAYLIGTSLLMYDNGMQDHRYFYAVEFLLWPVLIVELTQIASSIKSEI